MVDAENWASVVQRGLRSAALLIDEVHGPLQRANLKRSYRPSALVLPTRCRLRDQRPMAPESLARCLLDPPLGPSDWYALIRRFASPASTSPRGTSAYGAGPS